MQRSLYSSSQPGVQASECSGGNACMCRPVPEGFKAQTEGQATILQQGNEVFYNPAQVRAWLCLLAQAAPTR
jgi:hypothetical protein